MGTPHPLSVTLTTAVWSVVVSDSVTCGFLSLPEGSLECLGGVRQEVGDDLLQRCPIGVYLDLSWLGPVVTMRLAVYR